MTHSTSKSTISSLLILGPTTPARQRIAHYLEHRGIEVAATDLLSRALEMLEIQDFEVVILAIGKTFAQGLEGLSTLRGARCPSTTRIIAVGDSATENLAIRAFQLGADDFVSEPVDLPVLMARIDAQRQLLSARGKMRSAANGSADEPFEKRYRLGKRIGDGQFGAVFQATRLADDHQVAVKLLRRSLLPNIESRLRFRREIETISQIQHPNTVAMLESGGTSTENLYLVMELLKGHTLAKEIEGLPQIPLQRCCEILEPICAVLAVAHQRGIMHRDIKPQNIFLHQDQDGEIVKVLDFGIAKLVDGPEEHHLTREGIGPGTPSYMAPERFYEEPYDGAADIYSVGVMLHEMLVGALPFVSQDANPIQVAVKHMTQSPTPLRSIDPTLPPEAEALVLQALEKQPDLRPDAITLGKRLARLRMLDTEKSVFDQPA